MTGNRIMDCSAQNLSRDTVHFNVPCRVDEEQVAGVSRATWVGVAVNVLLAVVKLAAGILARSSVLLADAVHTLSDLATDAAILVGVKYWTAPADAQHPHGHRKIETLITLGIGVALAAVGCGLGYEAVRNLAAAVAGGAPTAAAVASVSGGLTLVAFAVAAVSIAAKELLYRWTSRKGVELGSSALIANAWHHRSDAMSSIPPLLAIGGGAIGARLGYNLWYLDPIGTIIVCVMLLQAAWEVTKPALASLLDASADRKMCSEIRKTVLATKGVIDTHRIRTRVICSNTVAVDLHITVDKHLSVEIGHSIATAVKNRLLRLNVAECPKAVDVLVHVEPGNPMEKPLPGAGSDTMLDWKAKE